jgi:hypothetical protein
MKVLLFVCSQTAIIDQQSNAMSVINIANEMPSPVFPFVIPFLTLSTILSRDQSEIEDPTDVQIKMHLQGKLVMEANMAVKFQGRLGLKHIATLQGIVIGEPGDLVLSIHQGEIELATWTSVIMHIGSPAISVETFPSQ